MSKSQDYWNVAVRWFLIIFVIDDVLKATTIPYRFFPSSIYSFWSTGIGLIAILLTFAGIFLFITKKNKSKQELIRLMALSLLSLIALVTFVLSSKFGWADNIRSLAWMLFFFIVVSDVFALERTLKNKKIKKITLWTINLSWTAVTLYSLSCIFYPVSAIYNQKSIIIPQGQMGGRLYGYFNDPNYAALSIVLVLLFTIWLISESKKILSKVLLTFSGVVISCYIIAAESRSGFIALAAGLGWLISYKLYKSIAMRKLLLRLTLSIATLIAAIGISLSLQLLDFSMVSSSESTNAEADLNTITEARGFGKSNDFSNGRLNIWREYAQLTPDAYLVGYSPGNLLQKIEEEKPNLNISKTPTVAHNTAIYALVSVGTFGFASLIVLFGSYLKNAWKKFKSRYVWEDAISISVLFATFIGVMFLNDLLFVNTLGTFLGFFALRRFTTYE
jgi:O-antigen ligase